MDTPVPVEPSPKFQLIVSGDFPPVVVAVKVTGMFTIGVDGDTVKLVARGGGVDDPKISVIGVATASLGVRVVRAQLFSIMCRIENSS
jgi:hypothetical protein